MNIVGVAQTGFYDKKAIEKKVGHDNFKFFVQKQISEEDLAKKVKDAEFLLLNQEVVGNLTEKFYSSLKKHNSPLKFVSIDHTGYEWTSPELAKKYGVKISNVPQYATKSVAEYTVATMLLVIKKLHKYSFTEGKSEEFKPTMNDDLYDKTVGVVGLGNIGSEVAKILKGFGCEVITWNREKKKMSGVKQVSLNKLFQDSDIITVHLVTNEETQKLFTPKLFNAMSKQPYFFNHTSESLIKDSLILKNLEKGNIKTYTNSRKYIESKKLRKHPNCISVPHQGWFTQNSLDNLENTWVNNIKSAMKGKYINIVNE